MKRFIILLVSLLMTLTLIACGSEKVTTNTNNNKSSNTKTSKKVILPEIKGLSIAEAIVSLNGDINLVAEYLPTNEEYPNIIMGYKTNKAGDEVKVGDSVTIIIASKPQNAYSLDSKINYVSEICKLTGPGSINEELLNDAGIGGTDLGFPVNLGDEMIYVFGDTFSGQEMKGFWYSNFVARSKDKNLNDGLTFDSVITKENGIAKAFMEGKHQKGDPDDRTVEVTKIPTGGIKIGDTTYLFYMSIRYWGEAGFWSVNYNQCCSSKDLNNWVDVDGLKWGEEEAPNFGQIYPYKDPNSNYIYIYGIEGGRNGGLVVARTTEANFLNKDEYEYKTGANSWVKGDEGLKALLDNPYYLINPTVSEMTVQYNSYLGKYQIIFYRNSKLILLTADTPDGLFTNPVTLSTQTQYHGIYGGLTCDALLVDGGKSFYMIVSCWEVYNTYLVKVVFN